jgi:hypothetical protein
MGLDLNMHIGPYLEVKGVKIVKTVKKVYQCSQLHSNNESNKFCPLCGRQLDFFNIEREEYKTPFHLFNDIYGYDDNQLYFFDEKSIAISKVDYPNQIFISDEYIVDLTNSQSIIDEQITWFKKYFFKEIEFFNENFGKENVSVKWGFIYYYS